MTPVLPRSKYLLTISWPDRDWNETWPALPVWMPVLKCIKQYWTGPWLERERNVNARMMWISPKLRPLSHDATSHRRGRDICCIRDALETTAMLFNWALHTKCLQRVWGTASTVHDGHGFVGSYKFFSFHFLVIFLLSSLSLDILPDTGTFSSSGATVSHALKTHLV